jgi:hypothetical protein
MKEVAWWLIFVPLLSEQWDLLPFLLKLFKKTVVMMRQINGHPIFEWKTNPVLL